MNFKNKALVLENFLLEEFSKKPPIALLKNGSIAYKEFILKPTKDGNWELMRANESTLDVFRLKTSALVAAFFRKRENFKMYFEIRNLDQCYARNKVNAELLKQRSINATDSFNQDLFTARYYEAKRAAKQAKSKITKQFRTLFW